MTVSQVESEYTGQSQVVRFAVTLMVPVVAAAETVICAGLNVTAQVADWVTEKVADPTLMVPVRDPPPVFACAL